MGQQKITDGNIRSVPDRQIVYLDFDGELTAYNGEILTVDGVNVSDSQLPLDRIAAITAELNAQYSEQNVIFVTERPESGDYSTIFIGKTSAFDQHGSFAGIAETIDENNLNKNDKAFVMLDSTSSDETIIATIVHETSHLLGTLVHAGSGAAAYAATLPVSSDISGLTIPAGETLIAQPNNSYCYLSDVYLQTGGRLLVNSNGIIVSVAAKELPEDETAFVDNISLNGSHIYFYNSASNVTFSRSFAPELIGRNIVLKNVDFKTDVKLEYASGSDVTLDRFRTMTLSGYGSLCNVTVKEFGKVFANSATYLENVSLGGGAVLFTSADSYGSAYISASITEPGKIGVLSGSSMTVSGENLTISGGMRFASGTFKNLTLDEGRYNIDSATVDGITLSRGSANIAHDANINGLDIYSHAIARIEAASAAVSNVNIYSGGLMYGSGTLSNINVHSGGSMRIDSYSSRTTVDSLKLHSGGILRISSWDITALNNQTGSINGFNCSSKQLTGTANNLYVSGYGYLNIVSGGVLQNSLLSGTNIYFSSGGVGSDLVASDGSFYIESGAQLYNAELTSGSAYIHRNGMVDGLKIRENAFVNGEDRGSAKNVEVFSGGNFTVRGSGSYQNIQVHSGGSASIDYYGTMENVTLLDGAVLNYNSNGYTQLNISALGTGIVGGLSATGSLPYLTGITENVAISGDINIASNAILQDAVIYNYADFSDTASGSNITLFGDLHLNKSAVIDGLDFSGNSAGIYGKVSNAVIHGGGSMMVSGTAVNTTVSSGGLMLLSGYHSGTLTIEAGAVFNVGSSGVIDFTLAGRSADSNYLINDLSRISIFSGSPCFTVTIDDRQQTGLYKLAGNAASFTQTLSVKDTFGSSIGTISVNGSFEYNNRTFTLSVTDNELLMNVEAAAGSSTVHIYDSTGSAVSSGLYFSDITLSAYQSATVESGGEIEKLTVSGGSAAVYGGSITDMEIHSGGTVVLSSGYVQDTKIYSGGNFSAMGSVSGTEIFSGGAMGVYGDAADTTVYSGGALHILNNALIHDALIHSGGSIYFMNPTNSKVTVYGDAPGVMKNVFVTNGSRLQSCSELSNLAFKGVIITVSFGGMVKNVAIANADLNMASANANGVEVNSKGRIVVAKGGTLTSGVINLMGSARVSRGGSVADTVVNSGGLLIVSSGAAAQNITLNDDGMLQLYYSSGYSAGTISATTPGTAGFVGGISYGSYDTYLNGDVKNVTISSGDFYLDSGSFIQDVVLAGNLYAQSGTVGKNITISSYSLSLMKGAAVSAVTVYGNLNVEKSASADGIVLMSQGYANIYGSVSNVEIYSGGSIYIGEYGYVEQITLHSGAMFNSGSFSATALNSDGKVGGFGYFSSSSNGYSYSSSGLFGVTEDVVLNGSVSVVNGGMVKDSVLSGGDFCFSSGASANDLTVSKGYIRLNSAASLDSAVLGHSGSGYGYAHLGIESGASASNVTILSSGHMNVYGSGYAENTIVNSGGSMYLGGDATAVNTIISGGVISAYNAEIYASNGSIEAMSGYYHNYSSGLFLTGDIENITIRGRVDVISGGVLKDSVLSGGDLYFSSGANAQNLTVSSGRVELRSGALLDSAMIGNSNEYETRLYVDNASASNVTIFGFGRMDVFGSGYAENTIVNSGGSMYVGGSAVNTTVSDYGIIEIYDGILSNTTLSGTGSIIYSNGIIQATSSGIGSVGKLSREYSNGYYQKFLTGVTENVTVYGELDVRSGGVVKNSEVSGGTLFFSSGTCAENMIVKENGSLQIMSGAVVRGSLTIADNARDVWFNTQATLDFDLTQYSPGNTALVNNFSQISGTPNYVITVSSSQADGTYILMNNVSDFTSSITVKSETGELGSISVSGDALNVNGIEYKLRLDSGSLLFDVKTISAPPQNEANVFISNGDGTILSSGYNISGMTLDYGLIMKVEGGKVTGTTINGGKLSLSSGGEASNTILNSGYLNIENGTIKDTLLYNGQLYYSSFTVRRKEENASGCIDGLTGNYTSSGGFKFELSGSNYGLYIYDNGPTGSQYLTVTSGAVLTDSLLNRTTLNIYGGGTVSNTSMFGGSAMITDSTVKFSDVYLSSGYITVADGGHVENVTLNSKGYLAIERNGEVYGTIVNQYGVLTVYNGGYAENTTVSGGGGKINLKDGIAYKTTLQSGGAMTIENGMAISTVISSGAKFDLYNTGKAMDTLFYSGGIIYGNNQFGVRDAQNPASIGYMSSNAIGGINKNLSISGAGTTYLQSGGELDFAVLNSATLEMESATFASNIIVNQGYIHNSGNAIIQDITLSGGRLHIYGSNAVASNITFAADSNGYYNDFDIGSGASAFGVEVNSGKLNIFSGYAKDVAVNSGGSVRIDNGGTAENMTVSSGGIASAYNKGKLKNTNITSGGTLFLGSYTMLGAADTPALLTGNFSSSTLFNGYASGVYVVSGDLAVGSGMMAEDIKLASNTNLFAISGGVISNTSVGSRQTISAFESGVLSDVKLYNGATAYISYASASGLDIYGQAKLSVKGSSFLTDVTIHSGGRVTNLTTGMTDVTIKAGGILGAFSFAEDQTVLEVRTNRAYLENGISVFANSMNIDSGKCASGLTAGVIAGPGMPAAAATVYVSSGGILKDLTLNSGTVYLEGGTLTGSVTLVNGSVSATNGEINFDLRNRSCEDGYLFNTFYNITGTLNYTITVDSSLECGEYKLAQNFDLTRFTDSPITIGDGNVVYGTLTAESDSLFANNTIYKVSTVDSALHLVVSKTTPAVEIYTNTTLLSSAAAVSDYTLQGINRSMFVAYGGVTENITVNSGGVMKVDVAGIAQNTVINSRGQMRIFGNGTANSTTINSLGLVHIAGGTASNVNINYAGSMYISSNGAADEVYVNQGGILRVLSGGIASIAFTPWRGKVYVSSGAVVEYLERDANIYYGNASSGIISKFNSSNDLQITNGNRAIIYSGGVASNVTVEAGGRLDVDGYGSAIEVKENGGAVYYVGTDVTFASNTISGVTLGESQAMTIHSNTVACDTTVTEYGSMTIYSGGIHRGTLQITSGAEVYVDNGTIDFTVTERTAADDYLINDLSLISGTPTYTITVSANQAYGEYKLARYAASCTGNITIGDGTINYGSITVNGEALVYGETQYSLTHLVDGSLVLNVQTSVVPAVFIYDRGTLTSSGVEITGATLAICVEMLISSGGVANSTTINEGGTMYVYSNGSANNTVVNAMGDMYIDSGATATEIVENGGHVDFVSGANVTFASHTISSLTLSSGRMTVHSNTVAENVTITNSNVYMLIASGGVANNTFATNYGYIRVYSGGVANSTTLNDGGFISLSGGVANDTIIKHGRINTFSNGTANDTFVGSNGSIFLYDRGQANGTIISGGEMHISSGGTADNTTINDMGCMFIYTGGMANNVTVNSAGWITVSSGGSANNVTVKLYGLMLVESGASVTNIVAYSDTEFGITVASDTYIQGTYANSAFEMKDAQLAGYTIRSLGKVFVSSGGAASDTIINENGSMYINDGGKAYNTTINKWAMLGVSNGGTASNTVINNNGWMTISSGGVHRGKLFMNGEVYASSGAVIDFTVAERTVEDDYLINNLSLISGAPTYTITVSANQAYGEYKLAQGAANFAGSITIGDGTTNYGSVTVNDGQLVYNGIVYSLKQSDGDLTLNIGIADNVPPELTISGNATEWTNQDIVLTAAINEAGVIEYFDGAKWISGNTITVSENGTYSFRATDAAGNVTEKSIVVDKIDKVAPTLSVVSDDTEPYASTVNLTAAVTEDDLLSVEYSLDNEVWQSYTESVAVTSNATVYFRATDLAGNVTSSAYEVANIGKAPVQVFSSGVIVSKAAEVTGAVLESGNSMHIISGGVANSTIINLSGYMYVSDGAVANSTTLQSRGFMRVSQGGVANDTIVNHTLGLLSIASGGVANNTTINKGSMTIHRGGVANNTIVNSGRLYISSGATATMVVENGGFISVGEGADVTFASNTISGLTLSIGTMTVHSNTVANSTTISGGSMYIFAGGVANNTIVNSLGLLSISSGGTADSTTISGGCMYIFAGGVANNTIVNSLGLLSISSGGTADSTTVNEGGNIVISDGGAANNTIVNSLGLLSISSGGTANNTTICENGKVSIFSGGAANNTIVNSLGLLNISSGGTADSTTVNAGGNIVISDGGVTNDAILYGTMSISSGGTANNTNICESGRGTVMVYSGGVANRTTINSAGSMRISSGGVANNTIVNHHGSMVISSGATATMIVENGGYVSVGEGADVTFASNTISGLEVHHAMTIHSNTVANITTLQSGYMYISSGGVANRTTVNSGNIVIKDGGVANDTVISSGNMYISSCGIASNTIVNHHGSMRISSGATATMIVENGGCVSVGEGANVTFASNTISGLTVSTGQMTVHSNTVAENTILTYGKGTVMVYSGGVANNTVISYGKMYISSGGAASDTIVYSRGSMYISSGATASEVVENGGFVSVVSGANVTFASNTISGMTISGKMTVHSNTVAENTIVNSRGSMFIYDGGIHRGTLQIASGAVVSAYEGGIIDFTVAERTVEDDYLINDLSLITGTPTYTITVSANQAYGEYKLAQGAANFAGSITIGNGTTDFGTLSTTDAICRNGISYTLALTDGNLTLSVTEYMTGSKDGVKFDIAGENFTVGYSKDDFASILQFNTATNAADTYGMPGGTYQWQVSADGKTHTGNNIVSDNTTTAEELISDCDGDMDVFFARSSDVWGIEYSAQHAGTCELVSLDGKNRIQDVFMGSTDANVLVLSDDANGDALFIDDVYSTFGEKARLSQIDEIRAGAGNDIVDLTSDKYTFAGDKLSIYGGAGDDTIWANAEDDCFIGGSGNDSIHGGGGNDIFCFGNDWGCDTVTQLADGKVTLYFASGSMDNWNAETQIYSDGVNSVTVTGTADITLKFGEDEAILAGAVLNAANEKIFEDKDKGMLA